MKKLIKIFDAIAIIIFVLMVLVVVAQIVCRFLLSVSTPWTEELSRLLFIYVGFMGTAIATRERELIVVDVVLSRLPAHVRKVVDAFIDLFVFSFFCIMFIGAIKMFASVKNTYYQSMPFLSNAWTYLAVIIGMGAAMLSLLIYNFEKIKGALKKHD